MLVFSFFKVLVIFLFKSLLSCVCFFVFLVVLFLPFVFCLCSGISLGVDNRWCFGFCLVYLEVVNVYI